MKRTIAIFLVVIVASSYAQQVTKGKIKKATLATVPCGSSCPPPPPPPPPPPSGSGLWAKGWNTAGQSMDGASVCPVPYSSTIWGDGPEASEGCGAILEAWSGAVWDPSRNRLVMWGGGHGDYGGNEIYTFTLPSAAGDGVWARLTDPELGIAACTGFTGAPSLCFDSLPPINPTGVCSPNPSPTSPNARHSYGGLAYLPTQDRMFIYGGSKACGSGDFARDGWSFSFAPKVWSHTTASWGALPSSAASAGISMGWSPSRARAYILAQQTFGSYDPATNTYSTLNSSFDTGIRSFGTVDEAGGKFVAFGTLGGNLLAIEIALADGTYTDVSSTAVSTCNWTASSPGTDYPGVTYDFDRGQIVIWPNAGSDIYVYNSTSHTCSKETYAGAATPSSPEWGIWGRFQYVGGNKYLLITGRADQPLILCTKTDGC